MHQLFVILIATIHQSFGNNGQLGNGLFNPGFGFNQQPLLFPPLLGYQSMEILQPMQHIPLYRGYHPRGLTQEQGSQGYANKKQFENENKEADEENYKKVAESNAAKERQSAEGEQQEIIAKKNNKAEEGFHKGENSAKHAADNKDTYENTKVFDKDGKIEEHTKTRKGFRKGHNAKGAKSSHTKDAAEKVETFYDEAHDAAGNVQFDGAVGSFGAKAGSSLQGGILNDKYNTKDQGEKGGFEKVSILDNKKGEKGQFGKESFNADGERFGINGGLSLDIQKGFAEKDGFSKGFGSRFVPF